MTGELRVLLLSADLPVEGRIRGGVAAAVTYLSSALREAGVTVEEVSAAEAWRERDGAWWARHVRAGDERSTVVHAHGAAEPAWLAATSPLPAVVTVHGVIGREVRHASSVRERWRTWRGERLARTALSKTRHLIAISEYVLDAYGRRLPAGCTVDRIANPVAPAFFQVPPLPAGRRRAPTILFAGRLTARKRPLDLVRAAALVRTRIPDARLRLAGGADGSERARLESEVRALDLGGCVSFAGLLREADLVEAFAEADVVCLPSAQETAPMSLAQALAAGRPIVATDVGGVRELAGAEAGVLVRPGDVGALGEALVRVLGDRPRALAMGAAGRARAMANHDPGTVARRTIEVYRRALADPAGRAAAA